MTNGAGPRVNCPACGAAATFQSTVSLLSVCPYCRSAIIRRDLKLESLGKVADLQEDGSPIQLGVRGEYRRVAFSVIGRIQMEYESGFWNEWYLALADSRFGWVGEAMGRYAVSFQEKMTGTGPSLDDLHPDEKLTINGRTYTVVNIEDAEYVSAEGELPFELTLGESATLVDLADEHGGFGTLDFSEEPCLFFAGEYVPFEQFRFQGLRAIEGWSAT